MISDEPPVSLYADLMYELSVWLVRKLIAVRDIAISALQEHQNQNQTESSATADDISGLQNQINSLNNLIAKFNLSAFTGLRDSLQVNASIIKLKDRQAEQPALEPINSVNADYVKLETLFTLATEILKATILIR